jgi:hypothetical protein
MEKSQSAPSLLLTKLPESQKAYHKVHEALDQRKLEEAAKGRYICCPDRSTVIQPGSKLHVLQPPDDARGCLQLQDKDLTDFYCPEAFSRRLETLGPTHVENRNGIPEHSNTNNRQKKRKSERYAKESAAAEILEAFGVDHIPKDQLMEDMVAISGDIHHLTKNTIPNEVRRAGTPEQKEALCEQTVHVAFEVASELLVNLAKDLAQLCKLVAAEPTFYTECVLKWLFPEESPAGQVILSGLHSSFQIAEAFRGNFLAVASHARTYHPGHRQRLRRSSSTVRCIRLRIPEILVGKFIGSKDVVKELGGKSNEEVNETQCCNIGKTVDCLILALYNKETMNDGARWDLNPGPLSMLPPGFAFIVCKQCKGDMTTAVLKRCNCLRFLETYIAKEMVPAMLEQHEFPTNEFYVPEHSGFFVLGTPYDRADLAKGALNARKFFQLKANIAAVSYPYKEKEGNNKNNA